MKKILSFIVRISITLVLLIFLFRRVDVVNVWQTIKTLEPTLFLLAFLLYLVIIVLIFWRWKMLLDALHLKVKRRRVFISMLGSHFFNLLLPSTIGGDVVRSFDLFGHTQQGARVVASVLLDRLSGFAGLVILSTAGFLICHKFFDISVFMPILILFVLVVLASFFFLNKSFVPRFLNFLGKFIKGPIVPKLISLHESLSFFAAYKKILIENVAVSIAGHLLFSLIFYILAFAMGIKVNAIYFIIFVPIVSAVSTLPISIGGLGLRDVTTVYFFSKIGIEKSAAFSMSLIAFFFMVVIGAIGGIVYVFTLRYRRIQSHQTHLHSSKPGSAKGSG